QDEDADDGDDREDDHEPSTVTSRLPESRRKFPLLRTPVLVVATSLPSASSGRAPRTFETVDPAETQTCPFEVRGQPLTLRATVPPTTVAKLPADVRAIPSRRLPLPLGFMT